MKTQSRDDDKEMRPTWRTAAVSTFGSNLADGANMRAAGLLLEEQLVEASIKLEVEPVGQIIQLWLELVHVPMEGHILQPSHRAHGDTEHGQHQSQHTISMPAVATLRRLVGHFYRRGRVQLLFIRHFFFLRVHLSGSCTLLVLLERFSSWINHPETAFRSVNHLHKPPFVDDTGHNFQMIKPNTISKNNCNSDQNKVQEKNL